MDGKEGNIEGINPQKERLDSLRERLYARDSSGRPHSRAMSNTAPRDVARDFERTPRRESASTPPQVPVATATQEPVVSSVQSRQAQPVQREASPVLDPALYSKYVPYKTKSRSYRIKLLVGGFAFFIIALLLSSFFLLWGNNSISAENISVGITGPFAVGGGEEINIQIAIANQNAVAIESATLKIEYPVGTQSAENPGQELFQERRQLDVIKSGEVLNIPMRAIVFGEENAEREILVSVEYRVEGSNAIFYKDAEPLRFKISSSPVVLLIDSVKSITSGQETEITLTVGSNAPSTLTDVLVKAEYPFGFDYSSASPKPDSAKDTWLIKELEPEEKETIKIKGIVTGKQDEDRVFKFSVGVPNERDRFSLASVFTTGTTELAIEDAFLGVDVTVNGQTGEIVNIQNSQMANVRVTFRNTLEDTIYDGKVEVNLGGNALDEIEVDAGDGFYDSRTNTITWDSVSEATLKEIAPGRSSSVSFTVQAKEDISTTPEITLSVTTKGQRVYEDRVPQELVSTASRTIRVESLISLSSEGSYSGGEFGNTGPMPPIAEEETEYSIFLTLKNGSNDITGTEMTAILPPYVEWLGNVSAGDNVTYEPTTRVLTWTLGDLSANKTEYMSFQIGVTPSLSQVNQVPTIIETQRVKATDRFTGTVIRGEAAALTTALPDDAGVEDQSGRVRAE